MKDAMELKICLVSDAAEFALEQEELQTFVESLNEGGGRVRYELVTDLPEPEAQYFYMLIGTECTDPEKEAFHEVYERFQEAGTPLLYTYFRRRPDDPPITQSVKDFMTELDEEIGHFFSLYTELDSVKLNILLELARRSGLKDSLTFRGGKACFGGREVLSLDRIPIYKENTELQMLLIRQKNLTKQFEEAAAACAHDPANADLLQKKEEISREQLEIFRLLKKKEDYICSLLMEIAELTGAGGGLTENEKLAIRELEEGNYEKAEQILFRADRSKAQMPADQILSADKKVLDGYVSENRLLIRTLMARGLTKDRAWDVRDCWEEILRLVRTYGLDPRKVDGYAQYLAQLGEAAPALEVISLQEKMYRIHEVPEREQAELIIEKGILYDDLEEYQEAERCMIQGVKALRELAWKHPQDREIFASLQLACYDLGVFEKEHFGKLEQAERYLKEAKEGYAKLLNEGENWAELPLARTYLSLGDIDQRRETTSYDKKAAEKYGKAMEIVEKYTQNDIMEWGQDMAELCLRQAAICARGKELGKAYLYAEKAWRTYDQMARISPALFQKDAEMARSRMVKTGMAEMQQIAKDKETHLEEIKRLNKQALRPKVKAKEKKLCLQKALVHCAALEELGVRDPALGDIYHNYANTLPEKDAEAYYEKAWECYFACLPKWPDYCLSCLSKYLSKGFNERNRKSIRAESLAPKAEMLLERIKEMGDEPFSSRNLSSLHGNSGNIFFELGRKKEAERECLLLEKYLLKEKEDAKDSKKIDEQIRENAHRLRNIYLKTGEKDTPYKGVRDSYTEEEVEDLLKTFIPGPLRGLISKMSGQDKYEQTAGNLLKGAEKSRKKGEPFEDVEFCFQLAKVLYCQLEEAFPGQYQKKIKEVNDKIMQHHSQWKEG